MLGSPNFEELVLKMLEVRGKKVEDLSPRPTTQGNPFPLFNILNLEEGTQNSYARYSI